ncbi:GNAT family N-acetyltransferase [Noviherbaspirillum denitrificans]|uniref:Acyltransferase n=1 Tax=Noviherbaspirillum denitrificans TaxID=1968433 RepID=A0A254T7E9_9BURK|nr:GNAT family protein [Noviherbaspirillum denitrificans]OWW18570.1 acyltransferase [Noviherbaspirillum denitrificans]
MNIHGKRVVLRAPEMRDAETLNDWANDTDVWKIMGGWHFPYSRQSTEKWILNQDNANLAGHRFCVEAEDLGLIGTASLINIDWKNRHAWHGMMLGRAQARGKGFGLDTVMAVMRYAFDELGLVRLDSAVMETNTRSLGFYTESCGWEVEGRRKNWFFGDGKYHDQIMIGITRESYRELIERTGYWHA